MKTMLGGWDENGLWAEERKARGRDDAPVSVLRCVPVSARQKPGPGAWQSQTPESPLLPALKRTLQAPAQLVVPPRAARAEPFQQLLRRQPPPLPSRWPAPKRRAPVAALEPVSARLARMALDATCELRESDLVVFAPPPAGGRAAAAVARGTLVDPAPLRRSGRKRFSSWLRSWFRRPRAAR